MFDSDLNVNDHMNYKATLKIITDKVIHCVSEVPGSLGTVKYLYLIQYIHTALINPDTAVLDRVYHLTFCVQFCRIWRHHLEINDKNDVFKRFITQNVFEGLELCLMFLLKLVSDSKAHSIHELTSQENESFFRRLRSIKGVESTITTCTMKEFSGIAHNINIEEQIMAEFHNKSMFFPRVQTRIEKRDNLMRTPNVELTEVHKAIELAMKNASSSAGQVGMNISGRFDILQFLKPPRYYLNLDYEVDELTMSDDEMEDVENIEIFQEEQLENNSNFLMVEEESFEPPERVQDGRSFNQRDMVFSDENTQSPFLQITINEVQTRMRKSTLVHMAQNGSLKISSDLLKRIQAPDREFPTYITPLLDEYTGKKDEIIIGDSIIVYDMVDQYFVKGTVFAFQFINKRTKKETNYSGIKVVIGSEDARTLFLMLDPAQYFDSELTTVESDESNRYFFPVLYYKCHVSKNLDVRTFEGKQALFNISELHN